MELAMPTYDYKYPNGEIKEIVHKASDPKLTVCPKTGQRIKHVITSASVIFKGKGFYCTDYKGKTI